MAINLVKNAEEAIEAIPSDQRREQHKIMVRAYADAGTDQVIVDVIDAATRQPIEPMALTVSPVTFCMAAISLLLVRLAKRGGRRVA